MKSNNIDCDSDIEIQETNCKKRKINEEVIIDSDSDNDIKPNKNSNGINGHSSNKSDTSPNTLAKNKNVSIVLDDDIEDSKGEVE
jgi:hypothetical protein